ncbi:MAG: hypothetical protein KDK78_10000, partial [Chlamydiia bacterium]|nr:hypothetical protein [Chlamydiia bacterium]
WQPKLIHALLNGRLADDSALDAYLDWWVSRRPAHYLDTRRTKLRKAIVACPMEADTLLESEGILDPNSDKTLLQCIKEQAWKDHGTLPTGHAELIGIINSGEKDWLIKTFTKAQKLRIHLTSRTPEELEKQVIEDARRAWLKRPVEELPEEYITLIGKLRGAAGKEQAANAKEADIPFDPKQQCRVLDNDKLWRDHSIQHWQEQAMNEAGELSLRSLLAFFAELGVVKKQEEFEEFGG